MQVILARGEVRWRVVFKIDTQRAIIKVFYDWHAFLK
jgi:hypothetical protein